MSRNKGYRVDRLRRRRRTKAERWQSWVLYSFAGVVAFAAVLGAWYFGQRWLGKEETPRKPGYLAVLSLTAPPSSQPVAAALAIKSGSNGQYSLYVIPKDLLLDGPNGEYVFAGDAITSGTLKEDLQRVISARVDGVYSLPVTALADLAGGDLQVTLERPVTLSVGGTDRTYEGKVTVPAGDLAALFAAVGPSGKDAAAMQVALWQGVLQAAALQPVAARARTVQSVAGASPGSAARPYLSDALTGLTAGSATAAMVPAWSRTAEGQFAFVPNPEGIMAEITRKAPAYHSRHTVLVRNGTGELGVGVEVAKRLAILDVNLPEVGNADNFDYGRTQIIAGRQAVQVAQDVRAILGRGIVVDGGADLAPATVVVIIGDDLKVKNLKAKD